MEKQFGRVQHVLEIPDGNWSLVLNAPYGGVVGWIVYNGTYVWNSAEKIEPLTTLVYWRSCSLNETITPLGTCKAVSFTLFFPVSHWFLNHFSA